MYNRNPTANHTVPKTLQNRDEGSEVRTYVPVIYQADLFPRDAPKKMLLCLKNENICFALNYKGLNHRTLYKKMLRIFILFFFAAAFNFLFLQEPIKQADQVEMDQNYEGLMIRHKKL